MAAAEIVKTTVTELPESRVRVEAEVSADEIKRRVEQAARSLGRDFKMPGFRKGKVPPQVVIQRVGRETVLDEAIRGSLGRWYVDAIDAAGIVPVGDPDVDLGDPPPDGQPLTFTIEIGVRPTATLGEYKGLNVPKREPAADPEAIDAQVTQLQERMARLETVDRAAKGTDYVVMDYVGSIDGVPFEGGEGRDQMVELGSGRLIPGFEEQLEGATAGEERTLKLTFPDEYVEHLAGQEAEFAVSIKEIKAKELPELNDDFASDAAGFDTLDELREDMASKLRESDASRAEAEFREAAVDAAVATATVDVPEALIQARAKELWERMIHSLSQQGLNKEAYLQIAQKTEDEILAEARPDAEQALRREAVIAAIVDAEGIEPGDGDLLDALGEAAAREGVEPEKLRSRLEKNGRMDELKSDLAQKMAVDFLAEHAKPVAPEAEAAQPEAAAKKPAAKRKPAAKKKPPAKKPEKDDVG